MPPVPPVTTTTGGAAWPLPELGKLVLGAISLFILYPMLLRIAAQWGAPLKSGPLRASLFQIER